ncbi:hypothetical protein TNCV_731551 [Trichonephila clavipes]|nr:hypothetical protein TNCV_731551 [Trichonephila clavipes]
MQLIPVRHKVSTELYIDAIGPLPIVAIRNKYILPDMCMSPRCHEAVPEKASTPLVETLLLIFRRRIFPKEIQTDEETLFMSISTTELFEKLGMPLRRGLGLSYRPHGWDIGAKHTHLAVRPAEFELAQDGVEYCGHVVGLGKQSPTPLKRKEEFVANVIRAPFDYVVNQKRMVWLPEGVGEKGFLESHSPTFRIDSSGKDMRRTGFEGPDWRQKA